MVERTRIRVRLETHEAPSWSPCVQAGGPNGPYTAVRTPEPKAVSCVSFA